MSGKKILSGLRDAVRGNIARVTIEGIVWTREDLLSLMVATERERCAKIALSHICTFGSIAEEIHSTATAKDIAADIRNPNK